MARVLDSRTGRVIDGGTTSNRSVYGTAPNTRTGNYSTGNSSEEHTNVVNFHRQKWINLSAFYHNYPEQELQHSYQEHTVEPLFNIQHSFEEQQLYK